MDVRKIIKSAGKTNTEAAKKMFPNAKYPYQALTRWACEGNPLNEDQIEALSEVTGYSKCQILEMRDRKRKVGHTPKNEVEVTGKKEVV